MCVQADEGPVEEGGQPETQGAAGEEQERPVDGGCQEERGQSERKFPADKGMWGGGGVKGYERVRQKKFLSFSLPCLQYCCYHNNASSRRDSRDGEQPEAMSNTHTQAHTMHLQVGITGDDWQVEQTEDGEEEDGQSSAVENEEERGLAETEGTHTHYTRL